MSNQDDILRKMNGLKIEHIKVFSKSKRVEITASSESLIPLQKVAEIESSITESFDGCSVTIKVRFTNNYSLSEIVEEYKDSLIYAIGLKMPALKGLLDKGVWKTVDGEILKITMPSNGTTLLRVKKSGRQLENLFSSLFNLNVKVEFDSTEIDEEYMTKYFKFKENEEQKVLSAIEADIISAEAADFEKQKRGSRKKGEAGICNAEGYRNKASKSNKANKVIEIIKGNDFGGDIQFIADIAKDADKAVVCGDVFKVDFKATKGKRNLCILYLTDYTSSVIIKYFYPKEEDAAQKSLIHEGLYLKVRGDLKFDSFLGETVIMAKDIVSVEKEKKSDDAAKKRVELHVHTRMSAMDGVTSAEDLISTAAAWGHKAVAITDHGVVQAFPEAYNAAKKAGIKVIYGVECYLLDDDPNEPGICEEANNNYVVFDIETTGLYAERDKITEIGAVRIVNGEITQEFCSFVNPGIPIPAEITSLTGITDEMVADAPPIREVIKEFIKFAGESTLVAHNASFDISFIKKAASEQGIRLNNPVVDTLQLSRSAIPNLKSHRLETVANHLQIDMGSKHRAKDDANTAAQVFLHCIKRMNKKTDFTKCRSYHAIILTKNMTGLKNLYNIISESHLVYYHNKPRVPKKLLVKYREGLILTNACESGELYSAIFENKSQREIEKIAGFYDVFEIQPLGNNRFLINSGRVDSVERLKDINKKIVELGEKLNKPVIATCDVHFLNPYDEVFRRILMKGQGFADADWQAPLYLRTTDEMLEEFEYLGADKAYEVVVENTNLVADMTDDIAPVPEGTFPPVIEGSEEQLRTISESKAREIYGDPLPELVRERMDKELNSIIKNGFSVMYIIAQKLVQKSLQDGYLVGSRGSVGSSFVANMAGITEVNSLPPHYVCLNCKHSEFITDGRVGSGFDLPERKCPECGEDMKKDGHDIPFETFLGFDGDKEPDIDLNFSGEYQPNAHKFIEELFGKGHVYRAGTISTIADKTAYGFVKGYLEDKGIKVSSAELERLVRGCSGIKKTTGQHPGGVMIVPHDKDILEFTPVQRPADDKASEVITTHFDYHSISGKLLKLDILGHDDPTVIKMLEDITGVDARSIPIGDKKTMGIFSSTEPLGITPESIDSQTGTFGVPEFGTRFVRQILIDTKPTTFSELVRIAGLSHGTDVWSNNAQDLIRTKVATLSEVICVRDDIMLNLVHAKLEPKMAFKISENVRKGRGLTEEFESVMREKGIPEWYIQSCNKIKYMFPKAHSAAYVTMAFRIAWFKVYYPEAFYAAYFTVRADEFDAELMCGGNERVKTKMDEIQQKMKDNNNAASAKEKNLLTILEVVNEMYARGIKFLSVDIYKSPVDKFEICQEGLRPPLRALQGLGISAALGIDKARINQQFLSKEDLRVRAGISSAVIKILSDSGCLDELPESSQMSLF